MYSDARREPCTSFHTKGLQGDIQGGLSQRGNCAIDNGWSPPKSGDAEMEIMASLLYWGEMRCGRPERTEVGAGLEG
jgi:hypothetical protein